MPQIEKEAAFKLIDAFARNQTRITHQSNSRRGVTQKTVKESKNLLTNLLDAMNIEYTKDEIHWLLDKL